MTNLGSKIQISSIFSVKKCPFCHQNPKWPLWKDFHQLEFLNQKWTFDTLCTDCPCSSFRTTFCILYFPMKLEFGIRRIDLTESFLSWAELEIYFSYLKLPTWTWKFSKVMKYVWPKKGLGRRQIMNFVWYLLKHRFQEFKESLSLYENKYQNPVNYSKCRIWSFQFGHLPPIFVLLKLTCLVALLNH